MTNGEVVPNQDDLGLEEPQDNESIEGQSTDNESLYNKQQVSDVVKRERQRAYEKGRKEAMMQMQQEAAQAAPQQQQAQQMNDMGALQQPQLTPEQVQQMIAEQAPQALQSQIQQYKTEHLVNTFVGKMQAAEQKYPGLEAELSKLNFDDPRMHSFIEMANSFDNTGEIMKEVTDNPHKLASLLGEIQSQPYLAQKQMGSLSQSIKQNEDAKAQDAQARDPMRQIKGSSTAGMDSGDMSVNDFRKMFRRK